MIRDKIEEAIEVKRAVLNNGEYVHALESMIEEVYGCLKNGGKLLIAGNGGSAADAQHFAGELVASFMDKDRSGYSVIALTTDTSVLTAWSNDFEYESVFERQVQAHGKKGDLFVAISTSGDSKNLIRALEEANSSGLRTISFLGKGGGRMKGMGDIDFVVPSQSTPRIQEVHILLIHILCEEVEKRLAEFEKSEK